MKNERQAEILSFIKNREITNVSEIAQYIFASESTIRRDITELSNKGKIKKKHGFVEYIDQPYESLFEDRIQHSTRVKAALAHEAKKLILDEMLIFIDSSSTCLALCTYLDNFKNLTIVTNGVETVNKLKNFHNLNVISTGGKISSNTTSMLGANSFSTINNYYADIFFTSCRSLNEYHTRESSADEAEIKQIFSKNARKTVLLFDEDKVNDNFNNVALKLDQIDTFITNSHRIDETFERNSLKDLDLIYI